MKISSTLFSRFKWKNDYPFRRKSPLKKRKKDHPLNFSSELKWKNYFEDVELWKKIQKMSSEPNQPANSIKNPSNMSFKAPPSYLNN